MSMTQGNCADAWRHGDDLVDETLDPVLAGELIARYCEGCPIKTPCERLGYAEEDAIGIYGGRWFRFGEPVSLADLYDRQQARHAADVRYGNAAAGVDWRPPQRQPVRHRRGSHAKPESLEDVEQRILDDRDAGMSLAQIAEDLNRDGVATPRGGTRWRSSTVHSILGRLERQRAA